MRNSETYNWKLMHDFSMKNIPERLNSSCIMYRKAGIDLARQTVGTCALETCNGVLISIGAYLCCQIWTSNRKVFLFPRKCNTSLPIQTHCIVLYSGLALSILFSLLLALAHQFGLVKAIW